MIEKLKRCEDGIGFETEDKLYYDTEAEYLQLEILGFCGCGTPYDVMLYVKEMLEKCCSDRWNELSYDRQSDIFFLYWADKKEFTEHGTAVRCSWLTEKGKELISDINKVIEIESKKDSENKQV